MSLLATTAAEAVTKEVPELAEWIATRAEQALEALKAKGVSEDVGRRMIDSESGRTQAARILKGENSLANTAPLEQVANTLKSQGHGKPGSLGTVPEGAGGPGTMLPHLDEAGANALESNRVAGFENEAMAAQPGEMLGMNPGAAAAEEAPAAAPKLLDRNGGEAERAGEALESDMADIPQEVGGNRSLLGTAAKVGAGAAALGGSALLAKNAIQGGAQPPQQPASPAATAALAQTAAASTPAAEGGAEEAPAGAPGKERVAPTVSAGAQVAPVDEKKADEWVASQIKELGSEPEGATRLSEAEKAAWKSQQDDLSAAYKAARSRNDWAEIAEKLGQAMVQFAAAKAGLRSGTDLSGVGKGMSTTDWLRKNEQLLADLKLDLGLVKDSREARESEIKSAKESLEKWRERRSKIQESGAKMRLDILQGNQKSAEEYQGRVQRASGEQANVTRDYDKMDVDEKKAEEANATKKETAGAKAGAKSAAADSKLYEDRKTARGTGLGGLSAALQSTDKEGQKDKAVVDALKKLGAGGIDVPALLKEVNADAGMLSRENTKLKAFMDKAAAKSKELDSAKPAAQAAGAPAAAAAQRGYSKSADKTYKIVDGKPVEERPGNVPAWW